MEDLIKGMCDSFFPLRDGAPVANRRAGEAAPCPLNLCHVGDDFEGLRRDYISENEVQEWQAMHQDLDPAGMCSGRSCSLGWTLYP